MPQTRCRLLLPAIVMLVAACGSTGLAAGTRPSDAAVVSAGITTGPPPAGPSTVGAGGGSLAPTAFAPAPSAPSATEATTPAPRTAVPGTAAPTTPRPTAPRPSVTPRATSTPLATRTPDTLSAAVKIVDFDFTPASIRVAVGTAVTWINTGAVQHTVTADGGAFGSSALGKGGRFSFTFSTAGSYAYHCAIHPFMTGTVVVGG